MGNQIDNSNIRAKLDLRRYLLQKYDMQPYRVLDCCQGSGRLWKQLSSEFVVQRYWGIDIKPKKGRLRIDSTRVLCQPGLDFNVIDIDVYGAPWKHWEAMLPNIRESTSVFLTIGQRQMGISNDLNKALGIDGLGVPAGICRQLWDMGLTYCLTRAYDYDIIIREAIEACSSVHRARYVGVRLEPQKNEQPTGKAGCPNHSNPGKEDPNV